MSRAISLSTNARAGVGEVEIVVGDARKALRGFSGGTFQACITSPPYWGLRDYGIEGQIGAEPTLELYLEKVVEIFRQVRRGCATCCPRRHRATDMAGVMLPNGIINGLAERLPAMPVTCD